MEGEITAPSGGQSIEEELRAVHAGLVADRKPEVFELPGYGRKLQVEYRVLSSDESDEIGEKIAAEIRDGKLENPMFYGQIDSLIKSCTRFYTEVDGERVPLEVSGWGDERLAAKVGIQVPEPVTARRILRLVMVDDRLVAEHAQEVAVWMTRALREVQTDFTQASPATPA